MIYILKIVLLILGSLVLQIALVARISIFGSSPDLPLALVVSIALARGSFHGEIAGFITGLSGDLLSGGPLGVQSLSKVVIGYFVGFVRDRLYSDNFITQAICGFVATLAAKFITSIHISLFLDPKFLSFRLPGILLVSAINSILVVVIFWIVKRLIKSDSAS